jgi:hypothetical protein
MRRLRLTLALLVVFGTLLIPSAAFARVSEYQVQYTGAAMTISSPSTRSVGVCGALLVDW